MNRENRRRNIAVELERGQQAMQAARLLLQAGIYPDASSRAYYAALHAARALLLSEGEEPVPHGGVQRLIGRDFVRTGRLPAELARALSSAEKLRLDADYTAEMVITHRDASEAVTTAEELTEAALDLLRAEGWMESP